MSLNRVQDNSKSDGLFRLRPRGEGKAPPGLEDTRSVFHRPFWPRQVENTEIHNHGIKAGVGERQRFRVSFLKLDSRIELARPRDHWRGKIDAHDPCSAGGRGRCYIT